MQPPIYQICLCPLVIQYLLLYVATLDVSLWFLLLFEINVVSLTRKKDVIKIMQKSCVHKSLTYFALRDDI